MAKMDTQEIEKIVNSLLPDSTVRQKCLAAFSESVKQAHSCGEDKWGVYYRNDKVRLLVGNSIVCTVHKDGVWLALEPELLNISTNKYHLLERSESWQWDTNDYPEYIKVPSRNGYYLPDKGDPDIWNVVRDFHFEFIRKVTEKYKTLNKRSQSNHKPEVLVYLSRILRQSMPSPLYVSDGLNPLQDIEQYQSTYENVPETQREAVVQSRVGQGKFRSDLLEYWDRRCAVTGCEKILVLKASHIKPWRAADNRERVDVYNGLLLVPNLDAAFDSGLITFSDTGEIIISPSLNDEDREKLGIHHEMHISKFKKQHIRYLEYHRSNIFEKR